MSIFRGHVIAGADRLPERNQPERQKISSRSHFVGFFGHAAPALNKGILFQNPAAAALIKLLALCAMLTQPLCHSWHWRGRVKLGVTRTATTHRFAWNSQNTFGRHRGGVQQEASTIRAVEISCTWPPVGWWDFNIRLTGLTRVRSPPSSNNAVRKYTVCLHQCETGDLTVQLTHW